MKMSLRAAATESLNDYQTIFFFLDRAMLLLNCWIRLHAGEVQQRLRVKFRLSALDVRRNALLTRLDFEEMVNYGDESVRHTRNFSRSEVGGFQLFI